MAQLLASWESIYSNSALLRTLLAFAHIAGLVVGGGAAIAADRAALSIRRRGGERRGDVLATIRATHRLAIGGLAIIAVSGGLLLAADSATFLHSWVFWVKMALVVLLLANGLLVVSAERRATAGVERAWRMVTFTAAASLVLWFLITLAGAALPNV